MVQYIRSDSHLFVLNKKYGKIRSLSFYGTLYKKSWGDSARLSQLNLELLTTLLKYLHNKFFL